MQNFMIGATCTYIVMFVIGLIIERREEVK
jgi:hypothetical protein